MSSVPAVNTVADNTVDTPAVDNTVDNIVVDNTVDTPAVDNTVDNTVNTPAVDNTVNTPAVDNTAVDNTVVDNTVDTVGGQNFADEVYNLIVRFKLYTNTPTCLFIYDPKTKKYILDKQWNIVFSEYCGDGTNIKNLYKLTQAVIKSLTYIVGSRGHILIYELMRFLPYSTDNEDIKNMYNKLYYTFCMIFNNKEKLLELMTTPNSINDCTLSTPLIGMIWQHRTYLDEDIVRVLINSIGVGAWTYKNYYNESAESLWNAKRNHITF